MAVSKRAKALYNLVFDGLETWAANTIQRYQERRFLKKNAPVKPMPQEYAKAYKAYWKKYGNYSPMWGWYYAARNGNLDVRYIPHTLYYTKLDQYFNARKLGYGFNDKNYYSKVFSDIKQPKVVVRKINGMILDENYQQISMQQAKRLILSKGESICKPSQESGSGRGIQFFSLDNMKQIDDFLSNNEYDNYIVQELLQQHSELERLHPGSVNCIRVCSLLLEDGVHILSSVLRMGFGDSRVDNATAKDNAAYDGMSCGIKADGGLNKYAFGYRKGETLDRHPSGIVFEAFVVPSYGKAIELVKTAHPRIANFRLVSWDISIDKDGEPVLIEVNMRKGGINFHQFNNGPLFGDLTQRVLDEVFQK